jgi:hypothetical protein
MRKSSPFWVSFFHARTGIEEGGAAGGSVKNMPATNRGPAKRKLCGERRSGVCGWMFPARGTKQCNLRSDEARGRFCDFEAEM